MRTRIYTKTQFSTIYHFLFVLILFQVLSIGNVLGQVTSLWEKSQTGGNLPSWFSSTANSERGLAYGYVGGNHRLYVVKNNIPAVVVLDAASGDSVGTLDVTGISGGTFALNDIEVSSDGVIFGCNLTTNASTSAFKVYKWANESSTPVEVINYTGAAYRLGDLFTVVGSTADNSIKIYAAQSGGANVVVFTTTDNGNTFTPTVMTVSGFTSLGSLPKVYPTSNGFWTNGNGQPLRQLNDVGSALGSVNLNLIPSNSNSLVYFTSGSKDYVIQYLYGPYTTTTNPSSFWERALILDVTDGYANAKIVGSSSFLGSNTNANGTGDISLKDNGDGTFTMFVLSTNNGLGAYTINPSGLTDVLTPPTLQNFAEFYPPANWLRFTGFLESPSTLTSVTSGWVPDDFGNVTSPVNRSAKINIYGTSIKHWLVSPTIDLGSGSTSYQLEYDLALTKCSTTTQDTLGTDDTLAVVISTDNGVTWSKDNIIKLYTSNNFIPPTGMHEIIPLTGYTGLVKIAFYGSSTVYNKDNDIFVDNFEVKELITTPQISVNPSSKDFGEVQINTSTPFQKFTILNVGAGALVISSVSLNGTNSSEFVLADSNTYPLTLNQGESAFIYAQFSPTSTGSKSASITIVHNGSDSTTSIPLSGVGVDFTITSFPYVQDFESTTFPPGGWLNQQVSGTGLFDRVTSGTNPTVMPKSGSAMVRFNSYLFSTGTSAVLISPPINFTDANYRIRFWMYRDNGYSTSQDRVILLFNSLPTIDGADTLGIIYRSRSLSPVVDADGWYEYVFMIPEYGAGNGKYIMLQAVSGYGNNIFLDSLAIEALPSIGWCNLQWPGSATINVGDSTWVFGQIWINGVTSDSGATPGLEAWVGFSTTNTDPSTWNNWVPAYFNTDVNNNDEFMAYIGSDLSAGTYYYATRFKYYQSNYYYGGYNSSGGGFWDGVNNVSGVLTVQLPTGPLSGTYYIPQGSHPKGFASLADAIQELNTYGANGTVYFLIDDTLNEVGANLRIYRPDLNESNNLVIKPAPGKTPTIFITGCSTTGETAYSGLTIDSTGFVTIDGSNTDGGSTRDLTFLMNDSTNGRIVIQLYENTDNIVIKNLNILFGVNPASSTSSRGIYANGLAGGVADSVLIENCQIGDGTYNPNYAVSITGYSTGAMYASKIYIRNNLLYGRLRTVYFFYGGAEGTNSEISGNTMITNIAPPSENALWGILFNRYKGTINIFNNKIQTLKMASSGTNGIYGIGTLNGQAGVVLNIYNNFIGGDVDHTGTGIPASIDMISLQDGVSGTVNIFHNTIVLNNMDKTASGRMTAMRLAGTWNKYVKNNIIVNYKTGTSVAYCILMGDTTGTFESDKNAFYVADTASNIGYWGAPKKTLADWTAASGRDLNSFVENPPFVSPNDLHIQNGSITWLESNGEPLGLTFDIDNDARDINRPDIGADEFTGLRPDLVPETVFVANSRLWNLLSVPVSASDLRKSTLFPNAVSNAFWYDGTGYLTKDTLEIGKGYWLKFDSAGVNQISGLRLDSLVIPVMAGWNLIGSITDDIPVANVSSYPEGIISSQFFGFNVHYYFANNIEAGKGYWVKTSSSGTLTLRKLLAKGGQPNLYVETIDPKWRIIKISDATGTSQELYLADQLDENKYFLPPTPPASMFDVRFESQRYAELDNYTQKITLQGMKYPVTLVMKNSEKGFYKLKDGVDGSLLNVVLKDGQAITISDPRISTLILEGATVPTKFELMQNYPNPFNPTTTIRYAIAEPVHVKLEVYNAIGERVKVLVDNEQEPGFYTIDFDASRFASGVYLIRLETPRYTKTIKSLLIK